MTETRSARPVRCGRPPGDCPDRRVPPRWHRPVSWPLLRPPAARCTSQARDRRRPHRDPRHSSPLRPRGNSAAGSGRVRAAAPPGLSSRTIVPSAVDTAMTARSVEVSITRRFIFSSSSVLGGPWSVVVWCRASSGSPRLLPALDVASPPQIWPEPPTENGQRDERAKCNSDRDHDGVDLTLPTHSIYPLLKINTRLIVGSRDGRDPQSNFQVLLAVAVPDSSGRRFPCGAPRLDQ